MMRAAAGALEEGKTNGASHGGVQDADKGPGGPSEGMVRPGSARSLGATARAMARGETVPGTGWDRGDGEMGGDVDRDSVDSELEAAARGECGALL